MATNRDPAVLIHEVKVARLALKEAEIKANEAKEALKAAQTEVGARRDEYGRATSRLLELAGYGEHEVACRSGEVPPPDSL